VNFEPAPILAHVSPPAAVWVRPDCVLGVPGRLPQLHCTYGDSDPGSRRRIRDRAALEATVDSLARSSAQHAPAWSQQLHSFLATSGPVIRFRIGKVEAMIASEAASPPTTVAQYAIPGMLNAMPTWECK
jgi:hypothetical protein